jgi:uncharacterized protein (TIGR02246 family)
MRRTLVALSTLLLVACYPAQQDTEADVAAIRTLMAEYDAAVTAGDGAAVLPLYAEDVISMPPDEASSVGRAGMEENFAEMEEAFEANTFQLTSVVDEVEVAGDLAFARVTFDETITPTAGGDTELMHGNWLIIFKRQEDGSWKIWREMWSVFTPEM